MTAHASVIGSDRGSRSINVSEPEPLGRPPTARWMILWLLAGLVAWTVLGLAFIGLLAVIGWGPVK